MDIDKDLKPLHIAMQTYYEIDLEAKFNKLSSTYTDILGSEDAVEKLNALLLESSLFILDSYISDFYKSQIHTNYYKPDGLQLYVFNVLKKLFVENHLNSK